MWLQGRKFRTLSEKPKNAIKIKIGCVVIKLRVLKLNPDHLGSSKIFHGPGIARHAKYGGHCLSSV